MKFRGLLTLGLICSSSIAGATVTTFTSAADFHAANPDTSLIENFEDSDPALREQPLSSYTGPSGAITFTPVSASDPYIPNVWLDTPGHMDVAPDVRPTASVVLTANGNEDFVGTLTSPANALGFDVMLNDWPLTLSFFNGTALLASLTFDSPSEPGNNEAFAGITSTDGITSVHWEANNGEFWDTGIDNIYAGPDPSASFQSSARSSALTGTAPDVPEPSSWAMMLLGFGAIGLALRSQARRDETSRFSVGSLWLDPSARSINPHKAYLTPTPADARQRFSVPLVRVAPPHA